jgi:hypothetical protein
MDIIEKINENLSKIRDNLEPSEKKIEIESLNLKKRELKIKDPNKLDLSAREMQKNIAKDQYNISKKKKINIDFMEYGTELSGNIDMIVDSEIEDKKTLKLWQKLNKDEKKDKLIIYFNKINITENQIVEYMEKYMKPKDVIYDCNLGIIKNIKNITIVNNKIVPLKNTKKIVLNSKIFK